MSATTSITAKALPDTDQADNDQDGRGDLCDADDDNDGVNDTEDNCPLVSNANQADSDNNQIGDFCDGEREFAEISSRADVGIGDNVAIGGFIVRGPQIRTAPARPCDPE